MDNDGKNKEAPYNLGPNLAPGREIFPACKPEVRRTVCGLMF